MLNASMLKFLIELVKVFRSKFFSGFFCFLFFCLIVFRLLTWSEKNFVRACLCFEAEGDLTASY